MRSAQWDYTCLYFCNTIQLKRSQSIQCRNFDLFGFWLFDCSSSLQYLILRNSIYWIQQLDPSIHPMVALCAGFQPDYMLNYWIYHYLLKRMSQISNRLLFVFLLGTSLRSIIWQTIPNMVLISQKRAFSFCKYTISGSSCSRSGALTESRAKSLGSAESGVFLWRKVLCAVATAAPLSAAAGARPAGLQRPSRPARIITGRGLWFWCGPRAGGASERTGRAADRVQRDLVEHQRPAKLHVVPVRRPEYVQRASRAAPRHLLPWLPPAARFLGALTLHGAPRPLCLLAAPRPAQPPIVHVQVCGVFTVHCTE